MPDTNPRMQITTAEVRQCVKKVGERNPARFGDLSFGLHNHKEHQGTYNPGYHTFEMDGAKSSEVEKDIIWTVQKLAKDWSSFSLTIYTDGSVTNCTEIGGGGILVTAGHPSDPTIDGSYAMPAGIRCSSFQIK